jgi:hypothetical protein
LLVSPLISACGNDGIVEQNRPAVCSAAASISAPKPTAASLFSLQDSAVLTADQEHRLGLHRASPEAAEVHVARLAENAASLLQLGDTILVTVSPTRSFNFIGTSANANPGSWSWRGEIPGQAGTLTTVLSEDDLTGTLWYHPSRETAALFRFWPLGGGIHALVCTDASKFGPV